MKNLFDFVAGFAGGWQGYALAAALAAAIAGGAAWASQDVLWGLSEAKLKAGHAEELRTIETTANAQLTDNLKWMKALNAKLSALDLKGFQEFINAQNENARLAADLGAGTQRLWVRIRLPDGGDGTGFRARTTGMGHDTALAELDPAFARSLHAIAGDGDSATRQLNGCQDYAETVSGPRSTQ
tara:strand:- start:3118 stop:3669 length:552 start_codon:yes stop_codon:yes gene_type:complete